MASAGESHVTIDHEDIRRWVEARGGRPARVKGTGPILRIDFPGYSGEETLEPISWDEFFRHFDERNLAFVYQDRTADGELSRFNKLVDRSEVEDELRSRSGSKGRDR
jgi:hypothetical protein